MHVLSTISWLDLSSANCHGAISSLNVSSRMLIRYQVELLSVTAPKTFSSVLYLFCMCFTFFILWKCDAFGKRGTLERCYILTLEKMLRKRKLSL